MLHGVEERFIEPAPALLLVEIHLGGVPAGHVELAQRQHEPAEMPRDALQVAPEVDRARPAGSSAGLVSSTTFARRRALMHPSR